MTQLQPSMTAQEAEDRAVAVWGTFWDLGWRYDLRPSKNLPGGYDIVASKDGHRWVGALNLMGYIRDWVYEGQIR